MCPEVADEANPGEEASPTVGRRCAVGADGSGLACCTLLLGLRGPTLLNCALQYNTIYNSFIDTLLVGLFRFGISKV